MKITMKESYRLCRDRYEISSSVQRMRDGRK